MSDTHVDDDVEPDQGAIAGLREAARQGSAALKENEKLKRELMFSKAGIDTTSELGELLFSTWVGDDIEELKAKATRLNVLSQSSAAVEAAAAAEAAARAAEDAQRTGMQSALSGGNPGGAPADSPDPRTTALEQYQVDIRAGMSEEMARTNAMGKVLAAGIINRDPRVLFDQEKHTALALEYDRLANAPR